MSTTTDTAPPTTPPRRRRRVSRGDLAMQAGLAFIALPWIVVPVWLLVVNSLKSYEEASLLDLSLPSEWRFDNYATVFEEGNYGMGLFNSLVIALPTLATVIVFGSMAAWAFARSQRVSMKIAYNMSVLSILLPPAILPTIYELQVLGIDGSRLGYYLVLVGTRLGVVVFLATGFVRAMSPDIEEAAAIDGASKPQIYRLLILPSLLPVLLVGGVILIITIWNEFLFALFLLRGGERATLPLGLFRFASAAPEVASFRWDLVFAHVTLTSLPIVIVYFFVQRRLVQGLSEGAVKG
ncbi:carbohydrate ABC transporter permease [Phycicoccus sp. BSK3Z-2]|uniref:Carbohydrate ABC transporter permease n=1 Tax=Phycicoccus avicenniae TaxID=2828860 RepID=A0A941HYC8_9MICO|nr:carbohydrate ABC transporter permease [Phycicoccus avicenniae]MBR7741755.1 carbohydrate ABC transporter permease [Phycicoccus avicenniae]